MTDAMLMFQNVLICCISSFKRFKLLMSIMINRFTHWVNVNIFVFATYVNCHAFFAVVTIY